MYCRTHVLATTAALSMALLMGCGKSPNSSHSSSNGRNASDPSAHGLSSRQSVITVTDREGQAIAGATVMIGMKANAFGGNIVTTDANGQAAIPAGWTDAQPVTIEASGFVRTTYYERQPDTAVYKIKRIQAISTNYELKGETTGYPDLSQDGWVDVGLLLPTVNREQLSGIQVMDLVSRETDSLTVIGRSYKIPSSLSIPTQTESYILPITLSKPSYRMYFPGPGSYTVAAVHARFKVDDIASGIKDKTPIIEMLNKFTFTGGTLKTVNIKKGSTQQNLAINQMKFSPAIPVTAPNFDNRNVMVSVALPEQNGQYFVSDIKKLEAKQKTTLVAPKAGVTKGLVTHLMRKPLPTGSGGAIGAQSVTFTAVIAPANQSHTIDFLDLVEPPKKVSDSVVLDTPRKVGGVAPAMTHAILYQVQVLDNGSYKLEKLTPGWELYANAWSQKLDLPDMTPIQIPSGQGRWEATFVGQIGAPEAQVVSGPETLEKATHVTRSAFDF